MVGIGRREDGSLIGILCYDIRVNDLLLCLAVRCGE